MLEYLLYRKPLGFRLTTNSKILAQSILASHNKNHLQEIPKCF
jgi:hypothetical protein